MTMTPIPVDLMEEVDGDRIRIEDLVHRMLMNERGLAFSIAELWNAINDDPVNVSFQTFRVTMSRMMKDDNRKYKCIKRKILGKTGFFYHVNGKCPNEGRSSSTP